MLITTKNGSQYKIFVDGKTNQMRVEGTPFELVVTDLKNLIIGERLEIKGYLINPMTQAPKINSGKYSYMTATIARIEP